MTMTTAATHRHGCRSGTASIAAGLVDGDESTTVISVLHRQRQLIAPLITGLSMTPFSTPQFVAICLYCPFSIRCSSACLSDCASGEPFFTGQPYGAASATSPAASSFPLLCLIAYSVTGESADIASAWPSTTALVAASCPSNLMMSMAGLPASVHALLLAGSSSVSSVVVACTATFLPHALFGSIPAPGF